MRDISLDLQVLIFPDQFRRGQVALILVRDHLGRYILGRKKVYPEGISRLLGGGVDAEEDPDVAAVRELAEETGLVATDSLVKLATITAHITNQQQERVTFIIHLYFYDCGTTAPVATDDVDELFYLNQTQFEALIAAFKTLPATIDPVVGFSWNDYGKLYSVVHQVALDEVSSLSE